jgi:CheY-like chemotaxis protein
MIRIVLVDDHNLVRTGLRMILETQTDFEVVAEADDGERGLLLIRQSQPDVALVDIHMPGFSGVEVTERVRRAKLATRILILTITGDAPFPRRLLDAGANGYLTKGVSRRGIDQGSAARRQRPPLSGQRIGTTACAGKYERERFAVPGAIGTRTGSGDDVGAGAWGADHCGPSQAQSENRRDVQISIVREAGDRQRRRARAPGEPAWFHATGCATRATDMTGAK